MDSITGESGTVIFPSWALANSKSFLVEDFLIPDIANQDLICPISRNYILDPVFANRCGHYFDKASIDEFIRRTRSDSRLVRCPICREDLPPPHVVPQNLMKAWIQQRLKARCPFDNCDIGEIPLSEWRAHIEGTCALAK